MTTVSGPELAVRTCARRLAPLGVDAHQPDPDGLDCRISWHGPARPAPGETGSEATVQALCGLMHLHGRDLGGPRRLGIEVATVAAGILAAQGVLAALVGGRRGRPVSAVETSVLQAGLLMTSHYVAAATCGEEWVPAPPSTEPGPPFRTADGHWFEIETLDPEAWKSFWNRLGAGHADLGRAWTLFRSRYYRGTCTLPPGLHEATARCTLAEVGAAAAADAIGFSPVRSYADVLAEPGPSAGHPGVEAWPDTAGAGPRREPTAPEPSADLPLAGLHVVEATSRMQGPLAGLLLQMLGARVTRVEPPGGDVGRMVPPLADDTGSFFLCFNRGKGTVELDLNRPADREELAGLVAGADVFLHNWRPGKAAEWGLDAQPLAAANPRLVYAEASGWGRTTNAPLVGTDFLVQAYAGLGHGLSPHGEPPFPTRVLLTDHMGALVACEGILSGLYLRELHGRGCRVETSLLAGAMAVQAHVVEALAAGTEVGRRDGRPLWGSLDGPITTADGLLVLGVEDDACFRALCQLCQVDPDGTPRALAERRVAERLAAAPAAQWEAPLAAAGIPCWRGQPDLDLAALTIHPRLAALFEPLAGPSRAPGTPWRFRP